MVASCFQQPGRIAFSVAVLLLAIGLGLFNGLGRLDGVIRDTYVASSPGLPAADVVVVAIGPECVARVGRWPWPREIHAGLIQRISTQQPLALGVDMVLSAPTADRPAGQRLAIAMARSADVVPPVFQAILAGRELSGDASRDPAPGGASQAGRRAFESNAASAMRNSLLTDGDSDRWWRHVAVGVVDTGADWTGADVPVARLPHATRIPIGNDVVTVPLQARIEPALAPAAYKTVMARDVMAGAVAPDLFKGRVVLVGVASSGLLDARSLTHTGPVHVEGGIDISAGIAGALLHTRPDVRIDAWRNAIFTVGMASLLLAMLWTQPPARAFTAGLVVVMLGLAASYIAWRVADLWVAPGALLLTAAPVMAVLLYRLSVRALPGAEFAPSSQVMVARLHPSEPLERDGLGGAPREVARDAQLIHPVDDIVSHGELQSLRDFLVAAIESLPDIILVCRESGQVMIGNRAAVAYFGIPAVSLRNRSLKSVLANLTPSGGRAWVGEDGGLDFAQYQHGVECRDAQGAEFLLKCAPCASLPADGQGWIVSLVDVAALHEAERRRDDAMRFLSHDMRSPLTAILALLTLHREDEAELPPAEMLARIRRLASRSLALAEAFVQLARAEPLEHAREPLDLADIVMDAADDCWSQAQAKRITIDVDVPPSAAQSIGDRELVRRAVINLVNNAVKFSPRGSRVVCAVYRIEDDWCVAIRDEGRGIAFEDRELLFKKFVRLGEREPDAEPGAGLGLAFTKTVVDRHGGRIEVDSVLGVGSEFRLYLKAA